MVKLSEAKEKFTEVLKLPRDHDCKLMWHHDYWDGPLTGICSFNDRPHWFKVIKEFAYELPAPNIEEIDVYLGRVFAITELTDKQFNTIKRSHELFRKYVGTHTDYTDNKRGVGAHQKDPDKFYNWYNNEYVAPNLSNNNVVGWFSNTKHSTQRLLNITGGYKDHKLYLISRLDLPVGLQAAQCTHAMYEWARKFPFTTEKWNSDSNNVALLSANNEEHLRYLLERASKLGLETVSFTEPDLDNELTAIVLEPGPQSQKICSSLPLLG